MDRSLNENWMFSSDHGKSWQKVNLPHDAQMTLQRTPDAAGGSATGYFPGGDFLYRRELVLTREEMASHVTLHFGGVYKNAEVSVNGKKAGGCCYGYLPFDVVADGLLREGANTIEVSCSNALQPDSRWYSGAGIYRPVSVRIQKAERIIPGSVRIKTMAIDGESGKAVIHVGVETQPKEARKKLRIRAYPEPADGAFDESTEKPVSRMKGTGFLTIPDAQPWSAQSPYLYRIVISLPGSDGSEADREEVTVGLRKIESNPDGFFINGERVLLKGGCIHSDNGVIGAREYREAAWRRIRILKQYGYNAIRSAHNPVSEELLDACDHLGMYVMDETWDMWYRKKNRYDYASDFPAHYHEDIAAVVAKDYNHPSVILYSIGNEVSEPAEPKGRSLGREMTALFHQLDPYRPVTGGFNLMIIARSAQGKDIYDSENGGRKDEEKEKKGGMNSTVFNLITSFVGTGMNNAANGKKADQVTRPILDMVDVAGYNYASGRYKNERRLHPERLIVGSETFPQDIAKNWAMIQAYPWVIGDFMWTAWDYLGEAGIGAWSTEKDARGFDKPYPWLLADTGALDITGAPNGEALLAESVWKGGTYLAVRPVNEDAWKLSKAVWRGTNAIPSWSFAGCMGRRAVAEVYTQAPFAELYLNGRKIGRKKVKENRAVFALTYVPGELKAVGVDEKGEPWKAGTGPESCTLVSAEKNLSICLHPESGTARPGGIAFLDITLEDKNGITESAADRLIRLTVQGAELVGFGSAKPRTTERFDAGEHSTWRGHALAVIRIPEDAVDGASVTVLAEDRTVGKTPLPSGRAEVTVGSFAHLQ